MKYHMIVLTALAFFMTSCASVRDCKFEPGVDVGVSEKTEKETSTDKKTSTVIQEIPINKSTSIEVSPRAQFNCPF